MAGFNVNLDALTENASRLGARIQETFSEHTRDLAARGSSALFLDTSEDKLKDIRQQLDVGNDRAKLEALKRLIAMISKGRNVSEYFAQVVKNVASQNLEVRKLVYIYLLRYAEQEPDLALLSINTFQRDLNDSNPLIRAMALRVLSGIRVPMIGSIVVLAIRKCAADPSPYVRKAAAFAVPKCYSLDAAHQPELIGVLETLLRDRSPLSLGSMPVAFAAVCPTRLDLLHPHYRRLCRTLADVDEWGQVNLLDLLLRYVRTMLARPQDAGPQDADPDLQLLLTCAEPLLMSRNPAVVFAVARVFFYAGSVPHLSKAVTPLLRIMQTSTEVERVVLAYLLVICETHSDLFAPSYTRFLVRTDDASAVKSMKIQLLLRFMNSETHQALLREFIDYAEDVDDGLVADAIAAVGRCALAFPDAAQTCMNALMGFIKSKHDVVVSSAVLVLKALVTSQAVVAASPLAIVAGLAQRIDEIRHPQARKCVLWLVGQYSADTAAPSVLGAPEGVVSWAPDVLRLTAKSFGQEASPVKLEVLTLAAKLAVLSPSHPTLCLLTRYVLELARYDADYDVRDRARMLGALLRGAAPAACGADAGEPRAQAGVVLRREQVRVVLFDGKAPGAPPDVRHADAGRPALLGALGAVTGREMRGDHALPDWLEQGTERALRDSADDAPAPARAVPTGFGSQSLAPSGRGSPVVLTPVSASPSAGPGTPGARANFKDLDAFYADDDESAESEEDEEGTGPEESEEDEDEEDGEEDGTESEESGSDHAHGASGA